MHVYAIVGSFSKNTTQSFDKTRVDTTEELVEKKQLFTVVKRPFSKLLVSFSENHSKSKP